MNILYIHQYFINKSGVGSARSYDIASFLVKKGHDITVICGRTEYNGLKEMNGLKLWETQYEAGIRVVVCNVKYSNKMGIFKRFLSFLLFAVISTLYGITRRDVDIIFASSTPLTVAIPGILLSIIKRAKYVFEVRDLWPEDLVAAKRIKKDGFIYLIYSVIEKASHKFANKVIVVSGGFYNRLIERGYRKEKIEVLPLGADGDIYKNLNRNKSFFLSNGIKARIIAIYAGAHGDANGLEILVDAANLLRNIKDIAIVLIGDGKLKPLLKQKKEFYKIENLYFIDAVNKNKIAEIISAADIGLLILKEILRPRWVMPNKLYDYMFSGLPIIVNFSGTASDFIRENQIGLVAKPNSARDLAKQILFYAFNDHKRKEDGERARVIAYKYFDRHIIAQKLEELFNEIIKQKGQRSNAQ